MSNNWAFTSPSAIRDGFAPGILSGGLLGPLLVRPLVKDTLCWSSYQAAYGTVTGELHPPPRRGNAHLTSSTAAPLDITNQPVDFTFTFYQSFTFTVSTRINCESVSGLIPPGRPFSLGGLLQHACPLIPLGRPFSSGGLLQHACPLIRDKDLPGWNIACDVITPVLG